MGGWGTFDDQNDSSWDYWVDLYKIIEDFDTSKQVRQISTATLKYINDAEKKDPNVPKYCLVGVFLIMLRHIKSGKYPQGDMLSNSPLDKILKESIVSYKIKNPEKLNKTLVKKMKKYVDGYCDLGSAIKQGWFNPQHRLVNVKKEKKFLDKLLKAINNK